MVTRSRDGRGWGRRTILVFLEGMTLLTNLRICTSKAGTDQLTVTASEDKRLYAWGVSSLCQVDLVGLLQDILIPTGF